MYALDYSENQGSRQHISTHAARKMLHNTLQTNATQMTPQARGTAVRLFSSALYIGQTAAVAAGALVIDRAGAPPLFLATAIALPALAIWFVQELKRFRRAD
jgi:predicted MFS family arabinose efflux permease